MLFSEMAIDKCKARRQKKIYSYGNLPAYCDIHLLAFSLPINSIKSFFLFNVCLADFWLHPSLEWGSFAACCEDSEYKIFLLTTKSMILSFWILLQGFLWLLCRMSVFVKIIHKINDTLLKLSDPCGLGSKTNDRAFD